MFQQGHSRLRLSSSLYGLSLLALLLALIALLRGEQSHAIDEALPDDCRPAVLRSIVGGDTLDIYYSTGKPMAWARARIHLRGITAPRQAGDAHCDAEAKLAGQARSFLRRRLSGAHISSLLMRVCERETLAGEEEQRVDLYIKRKGEWRSAADMMAEAGFALPRSVHRKSTWCDCLDFGICPAGLRWRFKERQTF